MQLLGVCGSLRSSSTNSRFLEAATHLLPDEVDLHLATLVGRLPLFNPDISVESSDVVMQWVQEMRSADGLIISTPEYARGYPGALENALDWLVDTECVCDQAFHHAVSQTAIESEPITIRRSTKPRNECFASRRPLIGLCLCATFSIAQLLSNQD